MSDMDDSSNSNSSQSSTGVGMLERGMYGECYGYGSLATLCVTCLDSGRIYEPITSLSWLLPP